MILSRVLAWLREEPNKGDFTKGKIKYGKDAITLGSDERSATPADKLRTVRFLLAKSPTTGLNVLKMGCRDYAILLLLARLVLRSGEVVCLELDGIDWNAGELSVRGKSGQRSELPLPAEVGQAIARRLSAAWTAAKYQSARISTRQSSHPWLFEVPVASDGSFGIAFCGYTFVMGNLPGLIFLRAISQNGQNRKFSAYRVGKSGWYSVLLGKCQGQN